MINIDSVISSSDGTNFFTEASAAGLKPGQWPEVLETTLGNGLPLIRHFKRINKASGDIVSVWYRQSAGSLNLCIYND